jgi:hypothetical protein
LLSVKREDEVQLLQHLSVKREDEVQLLRHCSRHYYYYYYYSLQHHCHPMLIQKIRKRRDILHIGFNRTQRVAGSNLVIFHLVVDNRARVDNKAKCVMLM